jgi:hypothetical protein
LNLAATSRNQTQILEDLGLTVKRKSALETTGDSIVVRDLLSANTRLCLNLGGGSASRDWQLAVAAHLMEAFVRFLFEHPCPSVHLDYEYYGDQENIRRARTGEPMWLIGRLLEALPLAQRAAALYRGSIEEARTHQTGTTGMRPRSRPC